MMTAIERIDKLHERAAQLQQKKNRIGMAVWGSVSVCLTAVLLLLMAQVDRLSPRVMNSRFAGSSMLSESTGGYVLAAVIAFAAGVIITSVIYWYRKKK